MNGYGTDYGQSSSSNGGVVKRSIASCAG